MIMRVKTTVKAGFQTGGSVGRKVKTGVKAGTTLIDY
jgi:hypothetical protein